VHFISESEGLGMAMILASKMTILGFKTNTSGTFFRRDRQDSLARPQFGKLDPLPGVTTISTISLRRLVHNAVYERH
jgi:hypothetical protein